MGSSSGLDLHFLQSMAAFRSQVLGTKLSCQVGAQPEGIVRALSDAGFWAKHISAEHAKLV